MLVNVVRTITGFDVARDAGVTQPTVSRALRNLPGVDPATRARVLEAARRLHYVPSDSGRALSTRVTRRIAVVTPDLTNPYYPQLVEPLRTALAARGLRTALVLGRDPAEAGADELVVDLVDGSYDGVVLTTTRRRDRLPRDLTARGIPHVLANRLLDAPESSGCAIDNARGAHLVVDLLVSLGHRDIGMVAGPVDTSTGKERGDAVRTRLRRHGLRLRREDVLRCRFEHDAGLRAATELLRRDHRPTALVCGNDVIAMGALSAARLLGLRVPADVTVVGFDDIPTAGWPLVQLTTVHCDLVALAETTVQMLAHTMSAPGATPRTVRLAPTLVLRGTHAEVPDQVHQGGVRRG